MLCTRRGIDVTFFQMIKSLFLRFREKKIMNIPIKFDLVFNRALEILASCSCLARGIFNGV